jgi:hypothetical protein
MRSGRWRRRKARCTARLRGSDLRCTEFHRSIRRSPTGWAPTTSSLGMPRGQPRALAAFRPHLASVADSKVRRRGVASKRGGTARSGQRGTAERRFGGRCTTGLRSDERLRHLDAKSGARCGRHVSTRRGRPRTVRREAVAGAHPAGDRPPARKGEARQIPLPKPRCTTWSTAPSFARFRRDPSARRWSGPRDRPSSRRRRPRSARRCHATSRRRAFRRARCRCPARPS